MIDAPSKYCTRCGETKPLNEYHKDRSKRDGHCAYCKPCVIAYVRKYQKDNPERVAEASREYREAHRTELSEKQRQRYYANREKVLDYMRDYRRENREEVAERKRKWAAENPHLRWVGTYRQRCKANGLDPHIEDFTRADVINRYGDSCAYCRGEFQELDHYVPVSKGGTHTLDNVRPSCTRCNRSKMSADPVEWLASNRAHKESR